MDASLRGTVLAVLVHGHVPGQVHQSLRPFYGPYTYVVTPRYFDADGTLLPLERSRSTSIGVRVAPFDSGPLELGFTPCSLCEPDSALLADARRV